MKIKHFGSLDPTFPSGRCPPGQSSSPASWGRAHVLLLPTCITHSLPSPCPCGLCEPGEAFQIHVPCAPEPHLIAGYLGGTSGSAAPLRPSLTWGIALGQLRLAALLVDGAREPPS